MQVSSLLFGFVNLFMLEFIISFVNLVAVLFVEVELRKI
jgi:hypothetical protein